MDRLAPQPRRLARKVPANPLGFRRDRPPSLPRRARPHPGQRSRRPAPRHLHPSRGVANLARPHFHHWPTDRVWLRDSGPIFVKIAEGSAKSCRQPRNHQLEVQRLGEVLQVPPRRSAPPPRRPALQHPRNSARTRRPRRIVLEGGSIDINGAGVLLTTEECLLSEIQQRKGLGSARDPRQARTRLPRPPRHPPDPLAPPRLRRRRHPRTHRRRCPLRSSRHHPRRRRTKPRR